MPATFDFFVVNNSVLLHISYVHMLSAVVFTRRYQWFCHFDDDVYVNVKQLSNVLQKYNHNEPYYIGRWPDEARRGENSVKVRY